MTRTLKTENQRKNEERNRKLYKKWVRLRSNPDNAAGEIIKLFKAEFGISAKSTIYAIINKQEAMQNEKNKVE